MLFVIVKTRPFIATRCGIHVLCVYEVRSVGISGIPPGNAARTTWETLAFPRSAVYTFIRSKTNGARRQSIIQLCQIRSYHDEGQRVHAAKMREPQSERFFSAPWLFLRVWESGVRNGHSQPAVRILRHLCVQLHPTRFIFIQGRMCI